MADENTKIPPGGYQVIKEGSEEVIRVNYEQAPYSPSIEDNPTVMMDAIDKLAENPSVARLIFLQRRFYEYPYEQTQMLVEVANLYSYLIKSKKVLSPESLGTSFEAQGTLAERYAVIHSIVFELLRSDPLGAYVELKRVLRAEVAKQEATKDPRQKDSREIFLGLLKAILNMFEEMKLVKAASHYLAGYNLGDRGVYRLFFRAVITPDFMFTRVMANPPLGGEEMEVYSIDKDTSVTLFRVNDDIKFLYHMTPPEFTISEDKYTLVDMAKTVLSEHQPKEGQFLDPHKLRNTFANIGKDLLRELAEAQNVELSMKDIKLLTEILIRHTIGFGFMELILKDQKVQDAQVNSPNGEVPIFVLHADYGNCTSNLIPARTDTESWASKFRLLSGRPLDEANPILDTELHLPNSTSRVSIITRPLNPYGLAFSFRRHRDEPWTLPLFVKNRMLNPLAAGLISFLVDGTRTMLVAGTRSSGKTSLLGGCMIEIMRKNRIITVEDSVTGDTELVSFRKDAGYDISTFEGLFDSLKEKSSTINSREFINNPGFKVFAFDNKGKIRLAKATKLIRHKVTKPIYEITTATGRIIKVTGDHSLFRIGERDVKQEIKASEIKEGDFILTPRRLLFKCKEKPYWNIMQSLLKFHMDKDIFVSGDDFARTLAKSRGKIKKACRKLGYKPVTANSWIRKGILPLKAANEIGITGRVNRLKLGRNSGFVPATIRLDSLFLSFLGLWLADGCYDARSVILSVSSAEERNIVKAIALRYGFPVKMHSDGFSLMINSKSFKFLMKELCCFSGNAYTKHIPPWVFNLSRKQKSSFLRGLFSGDGCVSDKEIVISLASRKLLSGIQTILLDYGIIFRINALRKAKFHPNDRTRDGRISALNSINSFKEIGFLQKYKNMRLSALLKKVSTHDSSDVVPLPLSVRNEIASALSQKQFSTNDYLIRKNEIGRGKLKKIAMAFKSAKRGKLISLLLENLAESDIFWDKAARVRKTEPEQYVYDISVPGYENFVCNNILAHNTLELPTEAMRKLNYDIQPLKVRAALMEGGNEMAAAEGIRTSLRMGDSALIIGEVRSKEAIALYEAMRIGAMANTVAGTIHGDSPYGVFDRVVNDLGVPRTSFKATDIIIVANPLKSPDGLHRWRRVTQITEVRKEWEQDPMTEGAFVDLMRYNSQTDQLEPTPELINGESEILKTIGANVKEWTGNWDAIWDNIMLRAEIKKLIVEYSQRTKNPLMLEAKFVIQGNDVFHRISEQVLEEAGHIDTKRILFEWEEWLKKEVRRKQMA
ncbi:MAG: ATPase, T2SS/T4P/T4SS family [Nanoarchaeota archaeon]|nr:ATPase, T2SS/T4P/T4SS family [Nanoarchaeota archaeon]